MVAVEEPREASSPQMPTSKDARINAYKERYRSTLAEYAQPSHDTSFQRAYSALVNTKVGEVFDALLKLEDNYAQSLSSEWAAHEREVMDIKSRHVLEIRRLKAHKVTNTQDVTMRHNEELDFLLASFESKLYTIYEDQKLEYRDYVMKMYRELQSRGVDGVSPAIGHQPKILEEGKTLISAAIQQLEKAPSSEMLLVDPSAEPIVQDAPVEDEEKDSGMSDIVMVTSEEAEFERKLKDMLEMGFSANDGEAALKMHNGQMDLAVAALLENPLSIKLYRKKEERAKASSSTTPQNGTGSKATSNPSSLNSTRAHSRMPSSQSSTTSPTNGALKFKKSFNHMLSKAMEAFKIEGRTEEESVSSDPAHFSPTSESFTVYFGSHVRNMYNLRIEEFMSDMANEFDPAHQLGWRASTASTLYSENLSGLIVLLDKSEFSRYAQGLSANRELIMECRRRTEFHFDNIVQQIYSTSKVLPHDEEGQPILKAGDFFSTKHSNLKSFHVVFHLITDKTQWTDKPSSQLPEIIGYRSILSVAHACDVTSLTLPVDLCLGKTLSDVEFYRRVETVLKNTKGSLMELNHHKNDKGARTGGSGYKFIFRYDKQRDIQQIAALLTGIFRIA